jgi:hypothetical protein
VERLVGWYSRHPDPLLHSSESFEVATTTILRALPPCGDCCCRND